MIKPLCVIQAPVATRSGYGDMARGIAVNFIDTGRYDVKIISVPWGNTPMNALSEKRPDDKKILDHMAKAPINRQPEIYVSITIPSEFQALGKYNIGITAGIETTLADASWIQGCNRMNLVLASSMHSCRVLQESKFYGRDQNGNTVSEIKLEVPCEVMHNGLNMDIFKKISTSEAPATVRALLTDVEEKFNFLFVGHWLQGEIGQDRKDVGMLIKVFLETFKSIPKNLRPGLLLKTSNAGFSLMEREEILNKIKSIKSSVEGSTPNVYLISGDLTPDEMNGLYNHYKVKAHVSLTKGEGFGRPLLEASLSQKPIIASGWSAHMDFLNEKDALLIGGQLTPVHDSAVVPNLILKEAQWFTADYNQASNAMAAVFQNYEMFLDAAKKLGKSNTEKFSMQTIQARLETLLDKYVPKMAVPVIPKLPTLPTLKKV